MLNFYGKKFRKFFPPENFWKIKFSEKKVENFENFEKSDILDLMIFRIFSKNIFGFGRKKFEKIKISKNLKISKKCGNLGVSPKDQNTETIIIKMNFGVVFVIL